MVRVINTEEIKPLLGNLSRPNYYQMVFTLPSDGLLRRYLIDRGVDDRFVQESSGLLCNAATIPGTSLATTESYNYVGLKQQMAHTLMYEALTLEFYCDADYKVLKFFQHWIDFVGSGNGLIDTGSKTYYRELRYPDEYKSDGCRLFKFENDNRSIDANLNINRFEQYSFIGLYPQAVYPVPVSYELSSQVMKVSVNFNYDRHVVGRMSSIDIIRGQANDLIGRATADLFDPIRRLASGDLSAIIN